MAKKQKKASRLTTDEAMDRIFGKGAAKKLHAVVEAEDAQKGRKTSKKKGSTEP
jgi:hypothetical protein